MYKILKMDSNYCYVGDLKTKAITKVPRSNGYEEMMVGDEVDVFHAENEVFIFKSEKAKPMISHPIKEIKFSKLNSITFEHSFSFLNSFKDDVTSIFLNKSIWISTIAFTSFVFIIGFLLSFIVNEYIINEIFNQNFLFFLNYIEGLSVNGTKLNGLVTTLFLMMSKMQIEFRVPFISQQPVATMSGIHPVVIANFLIIAIGLLVSKLVSLSFYKGMESWKRFLFLNFVGILSFSFFGIFGSIYRFSTLNDMVSIHFSTWSMVYRGMSIVFLLSCLVLGQDHMSTHLNQLMYTLRGVSRKIRFVLLVGIVLGLGMLYQIDNDMYDKNNDQLVMYITMATHTNFSTLIPYTLGSNDVHLTYHYIIDDSIYDEYSENIVEMFRQEGAPQTALGNSLLLVFALIVWFMDAQKYVLDKNQITRIASAVFIGFFSSSMIWLIANLATFYIGYISDGRGETYLLSLGGNGFLIISLVLSVLTLARYYLSPWLKPLDSIGNFLSKFRII